MRITEIERFNSYLYFYCVDNRIIFLIIAVNLNKVPFVVIEG